MSPYISHHIQSLITCIWNSVKLCFLLRHDFCKCWNFFLSSWHSSNRISVSWNQRGHHRSPLTEKFDTRSSRTSSFSISWQISSRHKFHAQFFNLIKSFNRKMPCRALVIDPCAVHELSSVVMFKAIKREGLRRVQQPNMVSSESFPSGIRSPSGISLGEFLSWP